MHLDPTAQAAGVRLIARDTIGSTNAEALRAARGRARATVDHGESQTAGRGRRGRIWVSEPGNLYASLLLSDPAPPERFPELSLVAALAVHDAIGGRIPGLPARVALKWPNDLLIDRCKFAGILVEGEGRASRSASASIARTIRPAPDYPATDLAAAGVRATRKACSLRYRHRCSPAWSNGTAARALPRSAPIGSPAPRASARRSASSRAMANLPASSKASTTLAAWFCASPMGQCRR